MTILNVIPVIDPVSRIDSVIKALTEQSYILPYSGLFNYPTDYSISVD